MSKVCIDAGHGGHDPGATGNGLREKDLNLSIALEVGKILKTHNVDVVYTRTTDVFISLSERANIANRADVNLFTSIHVNAGGGSSANGVEVFSYPSSVEGMKLSKDVLSEILASKIFKTNRGNKTANFAVLRLTKMPSILTETGFVDHPGDAQILKTRLKDIALSIAKGILKNLGVKYVNETTPPTKPTIPTGPHWAEEDYKELNDNGVVIHEKRFDDTITRGEVFSLLNQIVKKKII